MRYRIRQVWASRSSRLGKLLWNWPRLDIRHDFLVVVPFFFFLARMVASCSFFFIYYSSPSFPWFSVVVFPRPVIRSFWGLLGCFPTDHSLSLLLLAIISL